MNKVYSHKALNYVSVLMVVAWWDRVPIEFLGSMLIVVLIMFNRSKILVDNLIAGAFLMVAFFVMQLASGNDIKLTTVIHLLIIFPFMAWSSITHFRPELLIKFIKGIFVFELAYFLVSVLFLFTGVDLLNNFEERGLALRYFGHFSEASKHVLFLGLAMAAVIDLEIDKRWFIIPVFLQIVTLSGTGLLFGAVFGAYLIRSLPVKYILISALAGFVVISVSLTVFEDAIESVVFHRFEQSASGEDASANKRFLLIEELMENMTDSEKISGVGFASIYDFLNKNKHRMPGLIVADNYNLTINNIYFFVFAAGGIILLCLFMMYLMYIVFRYNCRDNRFLGGYVIMFPFFSGYLLHPLFWICVSLYVLIGESYKSQTYRVAV